jgi:hypothetical protein
MWSVDFMNEIVPASERDNLGMALVRGSGFREKNDD